MAVWPLPSLTTMVWEPAAAVAGMVKLQPELIAPPEVMVQPETTMEIPSNVAVRVALAVKLEPLAEMADPGAPEDAPNESDAGAEVKATVAVPEMVMLSVVSVAV